ncbi:MAG TPA: hypothetical protein P5572_14870 [Phycisphaerae bacterium]|nr:hypothetical protein [Phycisphaerae bacterium]
MSRRAGILNCALALAVLSAAPAVVSADEFIGEVTGTESNVHVRSGPSTNFYPVARIEPGSRVKVVGEESGWYAIAPLPGCFSLISKHYVDIGANGEGVVNGSAVRVRAGSAIDEHRYAVQTKLDKGAVVKVLGEEDEGFLKIVPPADAHLWIHSDYVVRVPAERLTAESKPAGSQPADSPTVAKSAPSAAAPFTPPAAKVVLSQDVADADAQDEVVDEIVAPGFATAVEPAPVALTGRTEPETKTTAEAPAKADAPALSPDTLGKLAEPTRTAAKPVVKPDEKLTAKPAAESKKITADEAAKLGSIARLPVEKGGQPDMKLREQLASLDQQFGDEMAKPVEERQLQGLVDGYTALSQQEDDRFVTAYAKRRLAQVELAVATTDAIRDIRSLSDNVARERRQALEARSQLRPPPVRMVMRGFDAKGELRESMIFASNVGPKRYRLVDPDATVPRTLCYVELADDSDIDIEQYLGRTVGIRASKQYVETDNVDPIPVVVAEEIVILANPAPQSDAAQAQAKPAGTTADKTVVVANVDTQD